MKIAFWSYETKQWDTSSYLAAISVASVIKYPYSIVLLESQLKSINLGRILKNNQWDASILKEPSCNYYEGCGIEGLVRKIYRGDIQPEILNLYITEILQEHLYYIPQSGVIHNGIFEFEFNQCLHLLLKLLENQIDLCFIDIANQINFSTKAILEVSDVIVVNLNPDLASIDNFIKNYRSIIPKSLFLISKNPNISISSIKKIFIKYQIPLDKLMLVPNNEMFKLSIHGGEIIDFISRYYYCDQDNPNYLFIHAIRRATDRIIRAVEAGINKRLEEVYPC